MRRLPAIFLMFAVAVLIGGSAASAFAVVAIANPYMNSSTTGWTYAGSGGSLTYDSSRTSPWGESVPISGAAALTSTSPASTPDFAEQCVQAFTNARYGFRADFFRPSGQSRTGSAVVGVTFYTNQNCTGQALLTSSLSDPLSTTDTWVRVGGTGHAPIGTVSMLLFVEKIDSDTNPNNTFTLVFDNATAIGPYPDFDGDGKADIVWRNYSSGLDATWNITSTPSVGSTSALPTAADTNWRIAGDGDFNNDGQTDLLWRHSVTGANAIWLMNGTTRIGVVSLPGVASTAWQIAGVADMNEDGNLDIVWRNYVTGDNAVWYLIGTGYSSSASLPGVADTNWRIVGLSDISGDGRPDVIWRHYGSGSNAVWALDGGVVTDVLLLPGVTDVNWQIVGTADFDDDGEADLLWRNYTTGGDAVWLIRNQLVNSVAGLPGLGDPNWQIGAPR